jgi:hypothetical protein
MKSRDNIRTQLQGQAGVYAVVAQLLLRGHIPFFPAVDHGYDIMLDNGIRIQVKSARLFSSTMGKRNRHPWGAYGFDTRSAKLDADGKMRRIARDYSQVADFFVLWGIDENRFWIVPTSELKGAAIIASRAKIYDGPQYAKVRERNARWEDNWEALNVASVSRALVESSTQEKI